MPGWVRAAADVLAADAPCSDQAAAVFPPGHCANELCGGGSPSSDGVHRFQLCLAASAPAKAGRSFTASDRRFEWGAPSSSAMQREDGAAAGWDGDRDAGAAWGPAACSLSRLQPLFFLGEVGNLCPLGSKKAPRGREREREKENENDFNFFLA